MLCFLKSCCAEGLGVVTARPKPGLLSPVRSARVLSSEFEVLLDPLIRIPQIVLLQRK